MRREHFICTVEGCNREHKAKGLCNTHYQRLRSGVPLDSPIQAWLNGEWSEWKTNTDGYVFRTRGRHPAIEYQLEHRMVMEELMGRSLLPGENVHHKNGNRGDNRPANLELWVTMQPSGQRVEDLLAYAREIMARYADGPNP